MLSPAMKIEPQRPPHAAVETAWGVSPPASTLLHLPVSIWQINHQTAKDNVRMARKLQQFLLRIFLPKKSLLTKVSHSLLFQFLLKDTRSR